MDAYLKSLDREARTVCEQYEGEIMVGLMFGGVMAIERSATLRVADEIIAGMKLAFLQHLEERGQMRSKGLNGKQSWQTISSPIASASRTTQALSLPGNSGGSFTGTSWALKSTPPFSSKSQPCTFSPDGTGVRSFSTNTALRSWSAKLTQHRIG